VLLTILFFLFNLANSKLSRLNPSFQILEEKLIIFDKPAVGKAEILIIADDDVIKNP